MPVRLPHCLLPMLLAACSHSKPSQEEPAAMPPPPDAPGGASVPAPAQQPAPRPLPAGKQAAMPLPAVRQLPDMGALPRITQRRPERPVGLVGAVYFVWYRQGVTRNPGHQRSVLGLYDSEDPRVIQQHLRWMSAAGIDFIAVSYWGYDQDKATSSGRQARIIKSLLNEVGRYGMKLCIMLEGAWTKDLSLPLGQIFDLFGDHPDYLRYAGKPVLFPFWRVKKQVQDDRQWKPWLDKFYVCMDSFSPRWTEYGFGAWRFTMVYDRDHWGQALEKQKALHASRDYLWVVPVLPGYDSRHAKKLGEKTDHIYLPRKGTRFYDHNWELAMNADPDWIMVTSWNGFPEWHGIEPSVPEDKFGYQYLERTAEWIRRFKEQKARAAR